MGVDDISNNTIMVFLVFTIIIAVISTWSLIDGVNQTNSQEIIAEKIVSTTGHVSLDVEDDSEIKNNNNKEENFNS